MSCPEPVCLCVYGVMSSSCCVRGVIPRLICICVNCREAEAEYRVAVMVASVELTVVYEVSASGCWSDAGYVRECSLCRDWRRWGEVRTIACACDWV